MLELLPQTVRLIFLSGLHVSSALEGFASGPSVAASVPFTRRRCGMRRSIAVMAIAVGAAMTPVAMATELNSEVEENSRILEREVTDYCRILKTEEIATAIRFWR